jgi:hypothetical protein
LEAAHNKNDEVLSSEPMKISQNIDESVVSEQSFILEQSMPEESVVHSENLASNIDVYDGRIVISLVSMTDDDRIVLKRVECFQRDSLLLKISFNFFFLCLFLLSLFVFLLLLTSSFCFLFS